ncbi:MAG: hypothetical protein DYH13_08235 [Alphaproteobacteria bacterium PRO2]|nr:hypothetical protein [Alphaproteobacteria bacterium PRO2]
MGTPKEISETIIEAFYNRSGSATCYHAEIRPIRERYERMREAGFNTEAIMIIDELLSRASEERILPGGEYPNGGPKSPMDVFNDFSKSVQTKVKNKTRIFNTNVLEHSMK